MRRVQRYEIGLSSQWPVDRFDYMKLTSLQWPAETGLTVHATFNVLILN